MDLNLLGEHPQGTPNVLTVRKPIGRLKELLLPIIDLPPKEKLNNFEIVIPLQTPKSTTQPTNTPINLSSKGLELTESANLLINLLSKELKLTKSINKTLKQAAP